MDNNMIQQTQETEMEIDLVEVFKHLLANMRMIIAMILVFALVAGLLTVFVIPKKYSSTVRIYLKPESESGVIDSSQVSANTQMVNNYMEMIKGNNITTQAAEELNLDQEYVSESLSVSNDSDTLIISITATSTDATEAKEIVDQVTKTFRSEVKENLNVTNIVIVDNSEIATEPSSPSLKKNIVIGAALGMLLALCIVFVRMLLDVHIHNKDEAEQYLGIPNLGVIPYIK